LDEFNLHTVLSLPAGCFLPYTGVKTNVLFFDRPVSGGGTKGVWYYDLTNDGFELKQTRRPVPGEQLSDFLGKWAKRPCDTTSWTVSAEDIASNGYDLSARNPALKQDFEHRPALELVQALRSKEGRIIELLAELEEMLEEPR
jgi:type I restriction enzyme M protein